MNIVDIDKMVKERFGCYIPKDPLMRSIIQNSIESYKNGILDCLAKLGK